MDEVDYMLKFKEEILEPEEKELFMREDRNSDELKVAKNLLCNINNDLKEVKIHEFRTYMRNEVILDHVA